MRSTPPNLGADTRAVSAVVGTIMMLGIVVVFGTIIGGFVMGVGERLNQPAPNSNIDITYDASTTVVNGAGTQVYSGPGVAITGSGGELLTTDNTGYVKVTGSGVQEIDWNSNEVTPLDGPNDNRAFVDNRIEVQDEVVTVGVSNGTRVDFVWVSPDTSTSEKIGSFRVPE